MCKNEECVDDVLVIYCAKHPTYNFTTVVGWYNHADIYRHYQNVEFNGGYVQSYNAIAKAKDCVLKEYMKKLLYQIENYDGENCIK